MRTIPAKQQKLETFAPLPFQNIVLQLRVQAIQYLSLFLIILTFK